MKKLLVLLFFVSLIYVGCDQSNVKLDKKVVVAYVTSWSDIMPDPTFLTHINYAFGHVNDSFEGYALIMKIG